MRFRKFLVCADFSLWAIGWTRILIQSLRLSKKYRTEQEALAFASKHNIKLFEDALGLSGDAYNATKASGIRFYKSHCNIKDSSRWDEFIKWHMTAAIKFKNILEHMDIPV